VLQRVILSWTICLAVALPRAAVFANSIGIVTYSGKNTVFCSSCHSGGTAPTVTLQGPPTLDVGSTGRFTLTVHSNRRNQQIAAGVGIAASAGTLIPLTGLRAQLGELTHSNPRQNNANDDAVFEFDWTAPLAAGTYTLFGAGNSVNMNFVETGDAAARTTLNVIVSTSVSPTPTPSPTTPPPTLTATPTRTPTSTSSPTSTPTLVLTATATVPADTPTVTATRSPSATPTRAVTPGDANCNNRITAADLIPVVETVVACQAACTIDPALCGVDVNRDQAVNELDIAALIQRLFAT